MESIKEKAEELKELIEQLKKNKGTYDTKIITKKVKGI